MRKLKPHSLSRMNPGPYRRISSVPRITLVCRVFTFCTIEVISGHRLTSSRTSALEPGNCLPFGTSVTSTSPLVWPTRTIAWRRNPVFASSRYGSMRKEGMRSRTARMIFFAMRFSIRQASVGTMRCVPAAYMPQSIS